MARVCFQTRAASGARTKTGSAWQGVGIGAIVLLGSCLPSAGFAFQPLITDDTGTQGEGGNQIELSLNRQRVSSLGDTTKNWLYPLVYTRGVTDALDVYAGASRVRVRSTAPDADAEGSGNPVLGLKWRAWEDAERGLSVGVKPEVLFGVSDDAEGRGLGPGRTSYGASAILTQETDFGAVHVNLAANRVRYSLQENQDENRKWIYRLSAAPVFEVSGEWKVALDLGLITNPSKSEGRRMGYAELGAIWSPSKDLDLALGYIAFLADGEPRSYTITAGVTWRFR